MIDDREIWACAYQLVRQYGEGAAFHAALRADELLEASDFEGQRIWLRILDRIEALEGVQPTSTIH